MKSRRPRVMMILADYPQLSQTYIRAEIDALMPEFEVRILSRWEPDHAAPSPLPYEMTNDREEAAERIRAFAPDVLHTHWLHNAAYVGRLAKMTGTPFTVRAHSFDLLEPGRPCRAPTRFLERAAPWLRGDRCLGVVTFPFTRGLLEAEGVAPDRIVDCFPVVDFDRFHDRSPNGTAVMNVGAGTPKKQMDDFLWLASRVPDVEFDLYPVGYDGPKLAEANRRLGSPARVHEPVDHRDMPAVYKRHRWLVYTASRELGTVGWPLAVAEAQASGVGVCMPDLRPDLREYVGPGAVLYESIAEIVDVVSRPVPDEVREQGFDQARKSDIRAHLPLLTDLWRPVLPRPSLSRRILGTLGLDSHPRP